MSRQLRLFIVETVMIITIIIMLSACGSSKSKEATSQNSDSKQVSETNEDTQKKEETKVTEQQAIKYIADMYYKGNKDGLELAVKAGKNKRYGISWTNPEVGAGAYWEVDYLNGDVFDEEDEKVGNILEKKDDEDEKEDENTKENENKSDSSEDISTPIDATSQSIKIINPKPTGDISMIAGRDTILNNFLANIKSRDKLENGVIRVLRDDLDNDGVYELVASFGVPGEGQNNQLLDTYLIKETEKGYKELDSDFRVNGSYMYKSDVVSIDNTRNKYIYLQYTDGKEPTTTVTYELIDGNLQRVAD